MGGLGFKRGEGIAVDERLPGMREFKRETERISIQM